MTRREKTEKSDKFTVEGRKVCIRKRDAQYQADFGRVAGKRLMKTCATKADAKNWLREQAILHKNQGAAGFEITGSQRMDAGKALAVLEPLKVSLADAARYYADRHTGTGADVTLENAVSEYIQDARDNGLRPRSIEDLEMRLGKLCAAFPGRRLNDIQRMEAQQWAQSPTSRDLSPLSRKHYRAAASGLYNFCIELGYLNENPFSTRTNRRTREKRTDEVMPGILSGSDVAKLMQAAEEHMPCMVIPLALGFFAGLRTAEIRGLKWSDIDLEQKHITIRPEVAKKRRTRHVAIEPNLMKWLALYCEESGLVAPDGKAWRYRFDMVRREAGLKKGWPSNAMRHCYASAHYRFYDDAGKTSAELGHRGINVLFEHYRALVTKAEAKKYWQIGPTSKSRSVVKFPAAG